MKIAVLAGGLSPEHDVSMTSGALVANALAKKGHSVALCDVYRPTKRQLRAVFDDTGRFSKDVPLSPPSISDMRAEYDNGRLIGDGVLDLCLEADLVFLALHGGMGEDGRMQAVLQSYGIPYTGSDFSACHSAMDKNISKLLCRSVGMSVPSAVIAKRGEDTKDIKFPVVIKPCSCGSSVGVSFADNESELSSALCAAFEYEDSVMIEERISGREFSVPVLGEAALPSVEIVPKSGTYDFSSKYQNGMTDEICPSRLTKEEENEIERLALLAHRTLGLYGVSRSDFILDEKEHKFYYLETNALPGMTKNSLMPKAAMTAGIEYADLCEKICELAIERNKK